MDRVLEICNNISTILDNNIMKCNDNHLCICSMLELIQNDIFELANILVIDYCSDEDSGGYSNIINSIDSFNSIHIYNTNPIRNNIEILVSKLINNILIPITEITYNDIIINEISLLIINLEGVI